MVEESSQPTKHANKILVSIFGLNIVDYEGHAPWHTPENIEEGKWWLTNKYPYFLFLIGHLYYEFFERNNLF